MPASASRPTPWSRARPGGWLGLLLPALFLAAVPLTAQEGDEPARSLRALSIESGQMELDGRLAEEIWQRAPAATDFLQQEPAEGDAPSRATEVRVAYDEDHLYIGAMIFDDPEGILAYQMERDAGLGTDDRFMWILDTFHNGRTGYFFEINANGLMGDGLLSGGGQGGNFNKSWDGIWEARVARLDNGWSAEIRIPFQTLNFDPGNDTWGINFQRTIRRTNEEILWTGHRRDEGLFQVIHAGDLTGLQGMSQGLGLEARAAAIGGWRTVLANPDPTTYQRDLSLDLNYNLTSSLRASVSVNTDFAEVEVDDRRVNLTRFPLRFQERRDFFLEGSGVFTFAPRSGPEPFFSRRIGLERGEQIPITWAGRFGGQVGPWELGFIQVETGETARFEAGIELPEAIPSEMFTVARVRRNIFTQSTVGAIYTRRATDARPSSDAPPPQDRHTAGVDAAFATTTLFGGTNAQLSLFAVWNSDPDPAADRSFGELTARGFRFNFPNDIWTAHLSYREFGAAYAPAVGFVTRNDFRRVEPNIGWNPRPESIDWLRQLQFSVQYRYLEGLESGIAEEKQWQFELLGMNFESGDNLDLQLTRTYEFLDEGFDVTDEVGILPGGYTNWEWSLDGRTAGRRTVSVNGGLSRGGFWDGDRTRVELGLTVRPAAGLELSADYEVNDVTLPRGAFTTELYRVGSDWNVSPWISLTSNVQYDDVSEIVGLFFRGRWILTPGNDLFVVYTQNWQNMDPAFDPLDRRFRTLSRGGALKVNYTYRF